jgi:hypothetical protein
VRYLSLAEALVVAEAVTGLDLSTLSRSPRIDRPDDAVSTMLAVAAGECDEAAMAQWLSARIERAQ